MFADYLRTKMEQKNMNVNDLITKVGCNRSTAYFWLAGTSIPQKRFYEKLAKVF